MRMPTTDSKNGPISVMYFHAGPGPGFGLYQPQHARLIGLGAALLMAAFATDIAFAHSLLFQWENFSTWLLMGGLIIAALAGFTLAAELVLRRVAGIDWLRFSGFATAALLSLINILVHSRDAYTAVVPQGIALSAVVTAILLILGIGGWSVSAGPRSHPSMPEEFRS